jgi:glutaredoxin
MFRASSRLLQCRVTFFTRSPCSLCDTAKAVVQNVKAQRGLEYQEINVMEPGQEKWKAIYEFDTPVVSLSTHRIFIGVLICQDPRRQSLRSGNNNVSPKIDASLPRRSSHQADGGS